MDNNSNSTEQAAKAEWESEGGATVGTTNSDSTTHLSADNIVAFLEDAFKSATSYIEENPREAAAIAVAAGLAGWLLLATKPGRKVFDFGVAAFAVQFSKWVSQKFSPTLH